MKIANILEMHKENMKESINKYEKVSLLGEGGTAQVFLVRHKVFKTLRAMKRIPKTSVNEKCYNTEIMVLNMMNVKGIPVIYDVDEDSKYWYIFEQYISGISFAEYLRDSLKDTYEILRYICEICKILNLLHETKPCGIIYGDVKPENIIINEAGAYLIDFGNCMLMKDSIENNEMATKEYVAPEQYSGNNMGIWTDVYGIGVLLQKVYQSFTMQLYDYREEILRIISICLEKDYSNRYISMKIVEEAISAIMKNMNTDNASLNSGCERTDKICRKSNETEKKTLDILVYGCRRYAGVTQLALGLTSYLNNKMYDAIYIEDNESKDIINMLDFVNCTECHDGIYTYKKCRILPDYGRFCVQERQMDSDERKQCINIYDCGVFNKTLKESTLVIVVITDVKEYMKSKYEDYVMECKDKNILYVANFSDDKGIRGLLKKKNIRILKMPYIESPFKQNRETEKFYGEIMKKLLTKV